MGVNFCRHPAPNGECLRPGAHGLCFCALRYIDVPIALLWVVLHYLARLTIE